MLKSKRTILGAFFCIVMALCLTLGVFGLLPKSETAFASGGTISTIADVLPSNFPVSHTSGWGNENGYAVAYVYGDKIYFHEKGNPTSLINFPLDTALTQNGANYTVISGDRTITFTMNSNVLVNITVDSGVYSDFFNGRYLPTVANILPSDFPISKETGWVSSGSNNVAYISSGEYIKFEIVADATTYCFIGFGSKLEFSNGNYIYHTVDADCTFVMEDGKLSSIEFTSSYRPALNGTYVLPAPKEGDKFTDADGINYEITSVGDTNTVKVGNNQSFAGTEVTIPGAVTYKGVTFDVTEIGREAFRGNTSITAVSIPNSVTTIGGDILYGTDITEITLPASVTTIKDWAFDGCRELKTIKILAKDVPDLEGYSCFMDCDKLEKIYVPASSLESYKTADRWSDYASKMEALVTIADILPEKFPTSREIGWANQDTGKICVKENSLVVDVSIPLNVALEKDGDNYCYKRNYLFIDTPCTATYTFHIVSGVLTKISVSGAFVGVCDGEYLPTHYFVDVTAGEFGTLSATYSDFVKKDVAYTVNGNKLTIGDNEITATANEGYEFDCWKIGETKVEANGTITLDTTFTATFKVAEMPIPEPEQKDDGLSAGAIVGISVGSVAGVCLITYVVMFIVWKKKGTSVKFLIKSFEWIDKIFKK